MAAHQPEESVSQYSYTKLNDSENKSANTAHSRIPSHSTTVFNGSKLQHSSGLTAATAAPLTPSTSALSFTTASATAATSNAYHNGRSSATGQTNVRGRNTEYGSRLSTTTASSAKTLGRQYQRRYAHGGRRLTGAAAVRLNPLLNAQVFGRNSQTGDPVAAYHEQQMRQKVQRLVSSTTRFDRVASGALAFLSDIARLYLLRIGEA
ncbi:hypothetical protein GGI05_000558, partial [Coemansia sp. RSA 2603]